MRPTIGRHERWGYIRAHAKPRAVQIKPPLRRQREMRGIECKSEALTERPERIRRGCALAPCGERFNERSGSVLNPAYSGPRTLRTCKAVGFMLYRAGRPARGYFPQTLFRLLPYNDDEATAPLFCSSQPHKPYTGQIMRVRPCHGGSGMSSVAGVGALGSGLGRSATVRIRQRRITSARHRPPIGVGMPSRARISATSCIFMPVARSTRMRGATCRAWVRARICLFLYA